MKQTAILATLLAGLTGAQAQSHLDLDLNHLLHQQVVMSRPAPNAAVRNDSLPPLKVVDAKRGAASRDEECVNVIARLREDAVLPEMMLQSLGITIGYRSGRFVALCVPMESLSRLAEMTEFAAIEMDRELHISNDYSKKVSHVTEVQDSVQAAQNGLDSIYTGRGVVVGVFDSGIDFNHNNFRDPVTHRTRIKKAIVYAKGAKTGQIITDSTEIDQLTTDCTLLSHGTHTASTAAGSYAGNYLWESGEVAYSDIRGAAYKADLVLAGAVSLKDSYMMEALEEMDKTATEQNEPLVVNLSIGSNGGWMDGKNTLALFMDDFTDHGNKPGRIVCISAGNEGNAKNTIRATLDEMNNYKIATFLPSLKMDNDSNLVYRPNIMIYGDDTTHFSVNLAFYEKGTYNCVDVVTSYYLDSLGLVSYANYSGHDGRFAAKLNLGSNYFQAGYTDCAVIIESDTICGIRLNAFDSDGGSDVDLDDHGYAWRGFVAGDASSSINTMALTNSVLLVGAWRARGKFRSYDYEKTLTYTTSRGDGNYAFFSSYVVADDYGRQKPDFCAPGVSVISGYNSYDTSIISDGTYTDTMCGIAEDSYMEGRTSLCGTMNGTSMSCPNATGVVALWLEQNPQLSVNEVRDLVEATATRDHFTAASPIRIGAGKINALAGLKMISNTAEPIYKKSYDVNGDGTLSVGDVSTLVDYILGR